MKTKQNIFHLVSLTSILAVTAAVAFISSSDASMQSMKCADGHSAPVASAKTGTKGAELMTQGIQSKEHASAHGCCPMMGASEHGSESGHKHPAMASASCCAKKGADATKTPGGEKK